MPRNNIDPKKIVRCADPKRVRAAAGNLSPMGSPTATLLGNTQSKFDTELAADQIIHLAEGWRYLASALYAFANHSEGAATHQAYYAELRAALSLFSGHGIKINNNKNAYLNSSGKRIGFPGLTHTIVWDLWNEWVRLPAAEDLLNKNIKLTPGVTLDSLRPFLGGAVAAQALEKWGYDLLKLTDDHNARNEKSYQPYWESKPLTLMAPQKVGFIKALWDLMLPTTETELQFDAGYIKYLITKLQSELHRGDAQASEAWLKKVIADVSGDCGIEEESLSHSISQATSDFQIFEYAGAPEVEAENVISRAFFLLRIATLSAQNNFHLPNGAMSPCAKWLENWLGHAGLWRKTDGISRYDAAEDYRIAVSILAPTAPLPETIWNESNAFCAAKLSRADACLIWGASY